MGPVFRLNRDLDVCAACGVRDRECGDQLTPEQVRALTKALEDIVSVLADAEPADKAELYGQLGISLAYDPDGTVNVEAHSRGVQVCVGGGI